MNTRTSRILCREEAGDYQVWDLPVVDGPITTGVGRELTSPPTACELEEIQRHAYEEGFNLGRREGRNAGYNEGHAAAQALFRDRLHTLAETLRTLARPLDRLDEEMERSLVEMTVLIARQLVRRELKTSPGEIVGAVREAVGQLPVSSRNPRIHLNPEDVEIVRQALALGEVQESYRLEEDPLITRGGCLIETATSFIDATVEARLSAIAARLFGGEREGERERND